MAKEANITTLAASTLADTELHRHHIGTPRCLGHKRTLLQTRHLEQRAQQTSCPNQLTHPETAWHVEPALMAVRYELEPVCDGKTDRTVETPHKTQFHCRPYRRC